MRLLSQRRPATDGLEASYPSSASLRMLCVFLEARGGTLGTRRLSKKRWTLPKQSSTQDEVLEARTEPIRFVTRERLGRPQEQRQTPESA